MKVIGSTTRDSYRLNYQDLREQARYSANPAEKLQGVCAQREFWHSDEFGPPASFGARGALVTLQLRADTDPYALRAELLSSLAGHPQAEVNACLKLASPVIRLALRRTARRTPL